MMCDNLSLYKSFIPSTTTILSQTHSTTMNSQYFPTHNDDQHRTYMGIKRKLSDYEDNNSLLTTLDHVSTSLNSNITDDDEDDDDDDDEDDDDEDSGDDETISDDESHNVHSTTTTTTTTTSSCTINQRRHSDTIHSSYGTPIVKRRCTYSSMHDDEQKRSVLVESYRKLRGVKKPKLQVSLLICNLIKRLEKTFTKTPPLRQQEQEHEHEHVQYYQHHHRTSYRSSSSDSIYMSPLGNDEIETTNQQYSSSHTSNYDSDKVLLPVNDLRTSSSMYNPSSTDAYWLAQSNFAVPVVSTSDDDDADVSLHGGGDYLDLSDNTLSSSFSSSSSPSSNDCCCSTTSSTTISKLLVDTNNNTNNNNNNNNDGYFIYHHHHHHHPSTTSGQTFFYPHNGNNTVDIITTA